VSYDILEASTQDGRPVYKFRFVMGPDEYLYTSAPYVIGDSVGTFEPVAIQASNVTQTNELAKNGIKITLPRDNALAQRFLGFTPEVQTSVTIFRSHQGIELSDDRVYWRGRVAAAQADGDAVTLECEDIFTSMRRPGLRARYQKGCRHALFSSGCGVNIDDYEGTVDITAVSGLTVTIAAADTSTPIDVDGYYTGGILKLADGSMRYIINHTGTTLTLIYPFEDLTVDSNGFEATVYPGCAHTVDACLNKFDNLNNYGGFPYLPGKNPFRNSVEGSIV
jgi:uncharacterized phage protein (TIGR02218 family)